MKSFKFLSESPLTQKLDFGHDEILKALQTIVSTCDGPFTIGLFGKWGSGKSSIAESLQKNMAVKDIPVILFDVWKHEGDALRRTFLKDTVRQLRAKPYGTGFFDMNFKLSDRIDATVTKRTATEHRKRLIKTILMFVVAPLFILLALKLVISDRWDFFTKWYNITSATILSITSIAGVVEFVIKYLQDSAKDSEIISSFDKITDPHDFEDQFKGILKALANPRVVIIFDNLDRVSGDSALEIISTIKTFLEPVDRRTDGKEVVFVVPCDVDAIKKHIKQVMHSGIHNDETDRHAEEFLRKFFNTILWIPEFYGVELEKYAEGKLLETKIPEFNDSYVSWLIIQGFRQNPRQIIQFINVLISNYLVLVEKCKVNAFGDSDFYKNNVQQLTKFLLLVQRFPTIMERYRSTRTYDLNEDILNYRNPDDQEKREFERFRTDTEGVVIKSLGPFFNFKIPEYEREISGVTKLFELMDDNKVEEAIKAAQELKIDQHIPEFSRAVQDYIKRKINGVIIGNFVDALFAITEAMNITLKTNAYNDIHTQLRNFAGNGLEKIKPSRIVSQFFKNNANVVVQRELRTEIVSNWAGTLGNRFREEGKNFTIPREFELDMITELNHNYEFLKPELKAIVRGNSRSYVTADIEAMELFVTLPDQERFIDKDFVDHLVRSLAAAQAGSGQLTRRVVILSKVDPEILNQVNVAVVTDRLAGLIQEFGNSQELDVRITVAEGCAALVKIFHRVLRSDEQSQQSASLSNVFQNAFDQSRFDSKHSLIPFVESFTGLPNQYYVGMINRTMNTFASQLINHSIAQVRYVFERIPDPATFIEHYQSGLQQLFANYTDHFVILYEFAHNTTKNDWLIFLINQQRTDILNARHAEIIEIGIPDRNAVFNAIINRLRETNRPQDWTNSQSFMECLKVDDFTPSVVELIELIITKVVQADPNVQKLAFEFMKHSNFLPNTDRGLIATRLIQHMRERNEYYLPVPMEVIASVFSHVEEAYQLDYINLMLDNLVLPQNYGNVAFIIAHIQSLKFDVVRVADRLESIKHWVIELKNSNNVQMSKALTGALHVFTMHSTNNQLRALYEFAEQELKV